MEGYTIVTGATGGMGAAAAEALASQGRPVLLACRNADKALALRERLLQRYPGTPILFEQLDLSSIASIQSFAEAVPEEISGLFNNAGTISRSGFVLTADGLESTFAVNYFGPWLLTNLLLPKMDPGAAVVNMVSLSSKYVRFSEESLSPSSESFTQLGSYAASKRALISFTCELARRRPDLRVNMADPGIVGTDILNLGRWFDPLQRVIFKPFCKRPSQGVKPALRALNAECSCRYFVGRNGKTLPRRYNTPGLDGRVWDATERILNTITSR